MKYYVYLVKSGVEPSVYGPYISQSRLLVAAKRLWNKANATYDNIFYLTVNEMGIVRTGAFSNSDLE